ncbi:testis-specific Y-encoded-like protein 5, partial [Myotis lucifugus]
GRKSSRAKGRGKGRAKGRARAAPDHAPRAPDPPDPPQGQRLGEEPPAAQVQAGAGWGGLESAALQLPGPGEDASQLPLDCGLALRAAGERGQAASRLGLGKATSLSERLAPDTVFVGTVRNRGEAEKRPPRSNLRGLAGKKAPGGKPKRDPAGEDASVPEEEEQKAEKDAGAGTPATDGSMDTLETVQQKLETMNAQADRAYLRLSRKFGQLRLHHLERRNLLIQSVPGFWGQALQNHPQLSSFLNSKDKEVLSYLNSLEVEELGLARLGYKIKFYFERNPYFQNKVLIKEYGCGPSGQVVSRSTPIQWLPGHDLQSLSQGSPDNSPSFFGWFSNHTSIESDKIVEIINEELWPNPLQYYLMSEGARGEKGKEGRQGAAKQPVETPEPGAKKPK